MRKIISIKKELIQKSKDSMLTAVQIFNNPNIQFKSESFVVLSIIAWTYLLHAYYRANKVDYRYYEMRGIRKKFDKTSRGAYKYWELERCINDRISPIDKVVSSNLRFLIGLRHEIEHQMTTKIDDLLSARFQACCLNYNFYLKKLFGENQGIEKFLSFSLQFSSLSESHIEQLSGYSDLPPNISSYIDSFDKTLSEEEFNDSRFSYRVLFVPKTANRKGQADKVIEFLPADSNIAKGINKEYVMIKEKEKPKYLPSRIIKEMNNLGYKKFTMNRHVQLWKRLDAKNPSKNFGIKIESTWYWYEDWYNFIKKYCEENISTYK